MENKTVVINSRKYDKIIHRMWYATLIDHNDSQLTLMGEFQKEINHPQLGVIRRGTISYEFYWLDRWYNVFRFHEPDGNLRNFYCNINLPPIFQDNILDYVDLDIDLLVFADFSYQILDREEFEENSRKYAYPKQLCDKVEKSVNELISLIEAKSFPFNYKF